MKFESWNRSDPNGWESSLSLPEVVKDERWDIRKMTHQPLEFLQNADEWIAYGTLRDDSYPTNGDFS